MSILVSGLFASWTDVLALVIAKLVPFIRSINTQ